jgi:hypothetical protein
MTNPSLAAIHGRRVIFRGGGEPPKSRGGGVQNPVGVGVSFFENFQKISNILFSKFFEKFEKIYNYFLKFNCNLLK